MIRKSLLERAKLKGSETDYFNWLKRCVSVIYPKYSEYVNGEGRCVVAHVRNNNAGVGYKPPYCAVPMTQEQHANQHQYGYSFYMNIKDFSLQANKHLEAWINGDEPTKPKKGKVIEFILYNYNQFKEFAKEVKKWKFARPLIITIKQQQTQRTLQQNKAIWLINNQIAIELQKDKDKMESFISDYLIECYNKLPKSSIVDLVHARNKFVFKKKSTTYLKKHNDGFEDSFEEYIHNIIHDMMRYGIYLNMPSKEYFKEIRDANNQDKSSSQTSNDST